MNRLPFRGPRPDPGLGAGTRDESLYAAIVGADIGASFEEYLEVFDRFYANDFQASFEDSADRIVGKAEARERLAAFLVPLHIAAEVCGVSVLIRATPIDVAAPEETRSAWTLDVLGRSGANCSLRWSTLRRWRSGQVVSEQYYDFRQVGDALAFTDLQPQIDQLLPWRVN
jgi:hypothetical protein